MKLKTFEILTLTETITTILKWEIPGKVALKLGIALRQLAPITEEYNKQRDALLVKLGTPDEEDSNKYTLSEENAISFREEEFTLTQIEHDVVFTSPLSVEDMDGFPSNEGLVVARLSLLFEV